MPDDRRNYSRDYGDAVVRLSHAGFLHAVRRSPRDRTARGAFADWLEDHDHPVDPAALDVLRHHAGPVWVALDPTGRVRAGRKWTLAEVRAANAEYARSRNLDNGGWFARGNMRLFGTRLHGDPVSGPGGVFFVHSGDNFDRTRRDFRIAEFRPEDGSTQTATTADRPYHEPYPDLASARAAAHALAARHPQGE